MYSGGFVSIEVQSAKLTVVQEEVI
jgi:hypothetical protein